MRSEPDCTRVRADLGVFFAASGLPYSGQRTPGKGPVKIFRKADDENGNLGRAGDRDEEGKRPGRQREVDGSGRGRAGLDVRRTGNGNLPARGPSSLDRNAGRGFG